MRLERGVLTAKDSAVCQAHRKLEALPLGIASIREIGIHPVVGADRVIAVTLLTGILRVFLGSNGDGVALQALLTFLSRNYYRL